MPYAVGRSIGDVQDRAGQGHTAQRPEPLPGPGSRGRPKPTPPDHQQRRDHGKRHDAQRTMRRSAMRGEIGEAAVEGGDDVGVGQVAGKNHRGGGAGCAATEARPNQRHPHQRVREVVQSDANIPSMRTPAAVVIGDRARAPWRRHGPTPGALTFTVSSPTGPSTCCPIRSGRSTRNTAPSSSSDRSIPTCGATPAGPKSRHGISWTSTPTGGRRLATCRASTTARWSATARTSCCATAPCPGARPRSTASCDATSRSRSAAAPGTRLENIKFHSAVLAHYVEDGHVPFHAVLNYDGQLTGQHGIHSRWESELVARHRTALQLAPPPVVAVSDMRAYMFDVLQGSFPHVERSWPPTRPLSPAARSTTTRTST